jgi:hypothetical protein
MPEGGPGFLHQGLDVLLDALRDFRRVVLEVLEQHVLLVQERFQPTRVRQRQMPTKDQAIEARQHPGDLVLVLAKEGVFGCNGGHGVCSPVSIDALGNRRSSPKRTPFSISSLVAALPR